MDDESEARLSGAERRVVRAAPDALLDLSVGTKVGLILAAGLLMWLALAALIYAGGGDLGDSVNVAAQQQTAPMDEVAQSARELSEVADRLQDTVDAFDL